MSGWGRLEHMQQIQLEGWCRHTDTTKYLWCAGQLVALVPEIMDCVSSTVWVACEVMFI